LARIFGCIVAAIIVSEVPLVSAIAHRWQAVHKCLHVINEIFKSPPPYVTKFSYNDLSLVWKCHLPLKIGHHLWTTLCQSKCSALRDLKYKNLCNRPLPFMVTAIQVKGSNLSSSGIKKASLISIHDQKYATSTL